MINIAVTEGTIRNGQLTRGARDWSIKGDINGEITHAQLLWMLKDALIGISKQALSEELAKGFDKDHLTLVDGRPNVPLEAVSPVGKIQFIARYEFKEICLEIMRQLQARNPDSFTGQYGKSHAVLVDGKYVAGSLDELESFLENYEGDVPREIVFFNLMPYARKLETNAVSNPLPNHKKAGIRSKKNRDNVMVKQPNGAYYLTYRAVSSKFRIRRKTGMTLKYQLVFGADLKFPLPDIDAKTGKKHYRTYKTGKTIGRPYVYPAIYIYPRGTAR